MKTWEAFFQDVLPFIEAGIPEPMVERQLLRAAQQFCQKTRAWRVELDPVRTTGQAAYDIDLPVATELVRIEGATLDGHSIAIWRADSEGCGQYVYTPDGKSVVFKRAPEADSNLVLDVTLKPGEKAIGIEDSLYDRYLETIALGAIARLNGDAIRAERFNEDCVAIRVDVWRGNAAIAPRARASWF